MASIYDEHKHTDQHAHTNHKHGMGYWGYIVVAIALAALTIFEIWLGDWDGMSRFYIVAGLIVLAAIKAAMVAAFYMHVLYESRVLIAILIAPLFLALLFGIILVA